MKAKTGKVTGVSLGQPLPRTHHVVSDLHSTIDGNDMNVPIEAVRSVANEFRINPDVFRDWLERRGYCIQDKAL